MERTEVKQRVLAIARDVHALAASSYGPTGRVKALQPNEDAPDAVELTTSAERICERIGYVVALIGTAGGGDADVEQSTLSAAAGTVTVRLSTIDVDWQLRNHCDGGLFTMILSSKLQLLALEGELNNTPLHLVVQGYSLALEWCLAYLEDASCPVRVPVEWSDTVALFAVMRGIISSKPIATGTTSNEGFLTQLPLLVEAFTSVLPFVTENPGESLPIRFVHEAANASSLSNSRLFKNSVLLDYQHHAPLAEKLIPLRDVKVLLFSTSVDHDNQNHEDGDATGILFESDCDSDSTTRYRELCDAIASLGVRVVISQKVLSEDLQSSLAARGIMSIHRLGISHMRAVELLTGATAIGDWRGVYSRLCPVQSLGFLSSVASVEVDRTRMLLLENHQAHQFSERCLSSRAWPVATLVLSLTQEFAYKELVHEIKSCFKRLTALMEESEAVAGAGCTEIHLAAWLRRNCQQLVRDHSASPMTATEKAEASTLRRLRTVINGFADALESVAVALDHGVHGMADEVKELLIKANNASLSGLPESEVFVLHGWDPVEGHAVPVVTVQQEESSSSSSDSDEEEAETDSRRVLSAFLLDSLQTKREALVSAVECATTLLRVAGVIYTTPGAQARARS